MSRLRAALAPVGAPIYRRDGGYLLDIEPDRVDLHRAKRLATEARVLARVAASDTQRERELLVEADALWRGVPLGGLRGDWVEGLRESLDLERLEMLIDSFEVELRLGRHASAIAPLSAVRSEYPLSEPLAGLQMLAMYRAGRQSDALGPMREPGAG